MTDLPIYQSLVDSLLVKEVGMSKSHKLSIAGGAFIIVAVMVIGAFSIGVYVGKRGWTAGPPSVMGPGGPPPPQGGQPPAAPRESLPKGKPDLIGVVQSITRRSVTIRTGEGSRLVLVGDETRVRWHDNGEARLADELPAEKADVVVDCTGHPSGFAAARELVKPRGTLVLKSTFHGDVEVNLSMLVVDEITLVGSRCGPFAPALRLLERGLVDVESLISATYPLDDGLAAFKRAQEKGTLKVLLEMT